MKDKESDTLQPLCNSEAKNEKHVHVLNVRQNECFSQIF